MGRGTLFTVLQSSWGDAGQGHMEDEPVKGGTGWAIFIVTPTRRIPLDNVRKTEGLDSKLGADLPGALSAGGLGFLLGGPIGALLGGALGATSAFGTQVTARVEFQSGDWMVIVCNPYLFDSLALTARRAST